MTAHLEVERQKGWEEGEMERKKRSGKEKGEERKEEGVRKKEKRTDAESTSGSAHAQVGHPETCPGLTQCSLLHVNTFCTVGVRSGNKTGAM